MCSALFYGSTGIHNYKCTRRPSWGRVRFKHVLVHVGPLNPIRNVFSALSNGDGDPLTESLVRSMMIRDQRGRGSAVGAGW